ncbi:hypothetical protein C0991_000004 [Blastosporella zonata]|nr:hypothetical protein C0991_000004 [Blastosporella zonata]
MRLLILKGILAIDLEIQPKRLRRRTSFSNNANVVTPEDSLETMNEVASVAPKKKKKNPDSVNVVTPKKVTRYPNAEAPSANTDVDPPQTMLAQGILENLRKFPHCLLLTRVGQFYESYFDQAIEISRLLGIKLTTRRWGIGRVPMCGFPLAHLDKHLKVLVQQNKLFVAMCEEFPHYSEGTKTFDRRVNRVVSPGTLIDEPFLNPFENNYLLAIGLPPTNDTLEAISPLGLAWIDVSTGEFFSKSTNIDSLRDELSRISPREVVLDKRFQQTKKHPVHEALAEDDNFVSYVDMDGTSLEHTILPSSLEAQETPPDDILGKSDFKITVLDPSPEESAAIRLLTVYLHANLLDHMPVLSLPNREGSEERMQIDSHTIKALEIREGFREGGTKGSLLSAIKRTVTTGGNRLLSRWLSLAKAEDTTRIVQKFILGRGDTADLLGVKRTVHMWDDIMKRVQHEKEMETMERSEFNEEDWASLDTLIARMVRLDTLSKRIGAALDDKNYNDSEDITLGDRESEQAEGLTSNIEAVEMAWRYGPSKWIIKPSFSTTLSSLHNSLQKLLSQRADMERDLQLRYDAPSLTLRASPAQGMHVHLAKSKRDQSKIIADPEFVSIAESASTRCFFFKKVNSCSLSLRCNARLLDELDVAMSFATLASELNFVRPELKDKPIYEVTNGRHPTVELGLLAAGRVFTPNSLALTPTTKLHVITGPNMAGKSTFLRQIALITILAQTGSFVPADFAVMGIVDKLFSRVGAKDDLFHDRSTFMVEMLETAEILRRATPKSLVIMDEVGRGTTVTDGLAIAYATLHHLVNINQSRALFATHFHELADMLGYPHQHRGIFGSVEFFCTDVDETDDDHFAYQYRVRPGVNRNSHGIKVAQLAGMPSAAVNVAKDTLALLKAREIEPLSLQLIQTQ